MTLDSLRQRFWWLGPSRTQSYIVALENDRVTVEITEHTWNRRTQGYEQAVQREFAALGLTVVWQRLWSEPLRRQLDAARARDGPVFDETTFIEHMRDQERRREETEP